MIITKKDIIIVIHLIITSLFLVSCTGSRELNRLFIVTSTGIDLEDEKVLITCEVLNPKSSKASPSDSNLEDTILIQGMGDTVYEAIRNATLHSDRKLFFSHNNILIIGEEFARTGISDFMDLFLRDNEPRENVYILVAKDSKAYNIMGNKANLGQSLGEYLSNTLDNFKYTGKSIRITIAEYYRYYYDVANEPVIGVVKNIEERKIGTELNKEKDKRYVLDLSGGSVLKKGSLIGYFSEEEILGYNFIVNRIEGGLIVFQVPEELTKGNILIGKKGQFTTVEILRSKTKNDIEIVGDKIHLTINVKLKVSLAEEEEAVDSGNPEILKEIEKACSEQIKDIISITMDKGQKEFKQDNFSIGVLVHHKYPEIWKKISKDWHNIFSEISYDVNVETNIIKTGIINTPSNIRKER